MKKEELLRRIQEGINIEESATAIYLKHLSVLLERSALPPEKVASVRRIFQQLIEMNRQHKQILLRMMPQVEQEPDHDF